MTELIIGFLTGANIALTVFCLWRMNRQHQWLTNDFTQLRKEMKKHLLEYRTNDKKQNAGITASLRNMHERITKQADAIQAAAIQATRLGGTNLGDKP